MKKVIANISRFLLALTFLFSGFVKANDPFGTSYKIDDYLVGFGLQSNENLSLLLAVLLSAFEFSLGLCLLLAIGRKLVSRLTFAFMAVMTLLTVYIYITDPVTDCGCFGDAIVLTNGQTLLKNIVLIIFAFVILLWHKEIPRLLSRRMRRFMLAMSVFAPLAFAWYCMVNLPVIDFRPFKIGTDMNERVQLPEVTDMEILVARYNALGLCVQDIQTEDDVTDMLFTSSGIVQLVVSPNINKVDKSCGKVIENLYKDTSVNGQFFFVTASSMEEISNWQVATGTTFPVYTSDDRTLKTIIRANPGLVTIKDGVIIDKSPIKADN